MAGIGYRETVAALTGGMPAVGSIAAACNITGLPAGVTVSGVYLIYKDIVVIITFAICGAYLISFVGGYIRVIITLTPKTTVSSPDTARKGRTGDGNLRQVQAVRFFCLRIQFIRERHLYRDD